MNVIYFAASPSLDPGIHDGICRHLAEYGKVETKCLNQPHVLVADVTHEDTNAGSYVGENIERNSSRSPDDKTRILCLSKPPHGEFFQRMSRLWGPALRESALSLEEYSSLEEAIKKIDDFFRNRTPRNPRNTFPLI